MNRRGNAKRSQGGKQLQLPWRASWGGARRGAGRRRTGRGMVLHRARPRHVAREPVHVTLRLQIRSLRAQFVFPTVLGAIRDTNRCRSETFRIVEFSVQADHIHLLVEAREREALLNGVRALSVRLARRLNRLLFRRGRAIADRWHGRSLSSPRAVRHALAYLFGNFRKHGERIATLIDLCSSAPHFRDFSGCNGRTPSAIGPPFIERERTPARVTLPAQSWLLRHGWHRHGRIPLVEAPAPRH